MKILTGDRRAGHTPVAQAVREARCARHGFPDQPVAADIAGHVAGTLEQRIDQPW
jgi:hypothetical protein